MCLVECVCCGVGVGVGGVMVLSLENSWCIHVQ